MFVVPLHYWLLLDNLFVYLHSGKLLNFLLVVDVHPRWCSQREILLKVLVSRFISTLSRPDVAPRLLRLPVFWLRISLSYRNVLILWLTGALRLYLGLTKSRNCRFDGVHDRVDSCHSTFAYVAAHQNFLHRLKYLYAKRVTQHRFLHGCNWMLVHVCIHSRCDYDRASRLLTPEVPAPEDACEQIVAHTVG